MLSSHDRGAALIAASSGSFATITQVSGFLFALLAAALIVAAIESVRER
jgi:hypothetical protein